MATNVPKPTLTNTTPLRFMHVGYGNSLCANKILLVSRVDSAQARRIKEDAKKRGNYYDLTFGRSTKSLIIMDDWTVFGCATIPRTLIKRLKDPTCEAEEADDDGGEDEVELETTEE